MIALALSGFPLRRGWRRWLAALAAAWLLVPAFSQEVDLDNSDKNRLDPFEEHNLAKADKVFKEKQYRAAAAEYDSFLLEFPQSRVRAYVLFRKARAIDLDNKRFDAINKFKEVLDYFPNSTYAAAALYYMGQCYLDTGDPVNAVKAWVEMAQDKDYRKHALAASALNQLAENAMKEKNYEKAMRFYEQVVTDFRAANPNAAWTAILKVIEYRMKTSPDELKLRAFYVKAKGLDYNPQKIADDPAASRDYWAFIRAKVREFGAQFDNNTQARDRQKFYRYWADVMENKFPDNDDFQIDYIEFRNAQENDLDRRTKRLDAQFAQYQKKDDYARIIKWLNLYLGNKAKINEYYAKLDLSKLGQAGIEQLVFALLNQKEYGMALNAFDKLSFANMTDAARENFSRRLWEPIKAGFSITALERIANSFTDKDYGALVLLRYYYWIRNAGAGIPIGEKLRANPKFATEALTCMGDLYYWSHQYVKAIPCYQEANNPPATIFQIAYCYAELGKVDTAVATLREVENFFVKEAPRAAWTIVSFYQQAGLKDKHVAALRALMKKYPGSPESSLAHQELEKMGLKIGGGVDTE